MTVNVVDTHRQPKEDKHLRDTHHKPHSESCLTCNQMTLFFDPNHERNVTSSHKRSDKTFTVAPVRVSILHVPVPIVPIHSTRRPNTRFRLTLSDLKSTRHTTVSSSASKRPWERLVNCRLIFAVRPSSCSLTSTDGPAHETQVIASNVNPQARRARHASECTPPCIA